MPAIAPDDSPLCVAPASALSVGVSVDPAPGISEPVGLANPTPTDCPAPDEPPSPVEPGEPDSPDGFPAALAGEEAPEEKSWLEELPVTAAGEPDNEVLGCAELPLGGLDPGLFPAFTGGAGVLPLPAALDIPGPLPPFPLLDPPLLLPPPPPPPDPPLLPPPLPLPFPFPFPFPDPPPLPPPFAFPDPPLLLPPFPLLDAGVAAGALEGVLPGPRTVFNNPPTA